MVVCDVRPDKDDPERTRITIGGNRICYPEDVGTNTASLELFKLLLNSVLRPGISRDGVARDVSTAGRDCSAMEGIGGVGIFGRGGERRLPKRPDLPIGHGGSSIFRNGGLHPSRKHDGSG